MAAKRKSKSKRGNRASVQYKKEKDETLSEVRVSSFEVIRLRRVKYAENPHEFIDLRLYQRGFDDQENEVLYPTRKGVQMKESLFLKLMKGY